MDPRPIDEDLRLCYPEAYFTHDAPATTDLPRDGWKGRARSMVLGSTRYGYPEPSVGPTVVGSMMAAVPSVRERAASGIGPLLPPWVENGRVLDIGCGSGGLLGMMRQLGWQIVGVEVDPQAASVARASLGVDVVGSVAAAREFGPFDAITMSHVLEHVPAPPLFLEEAANLLAPGGYLLAVTPNVDSLGQRWFGEDWLPLEAPRHLVIMSPRGLRRSLQGAPSLRSIEITTTARIAGKIARERAWVRLSGRFRQGDLNRWDREIAPRLFSILERTVAVVSPVGEELVLVAKRR